MSPEASFSGEALFRGLFFRDGEVAHLLGDLWGGTPSPEDMLNEKQLREARAYAGRVIDHVHRGSPDFLDQFALTMQSGDHLAIEKIMAVASGELIRGIAEEEGMSMEDLKSEMSAWARTNDDTYLDDGKCLYPFVTVAAAFHAAVAAYSAVAVAVFAAVDVSVVYHLNAFWGGGGEDDLEEQEDPGSSRTLKREMAVDTIVKRLSR